MNSVIPQVISQQYCIYQAGSAGLSAMAIACPLDGFLTFLSLSAWMSTGSVDTIDFALCRISDSPIPATTFIPTSNVQFPGQCYLGLELTATTVANTVAISRGTILVAPERSRQLMIPMARGQTFSFQANSFGSVNNNVYWYLIAEWTGGRTRVVPGSGVKR